MTSLCVPSAQVCTLCFFGWFTSVQVIIGSHLLGAFVAGMCFVNVPRSQAIWNGQMKRIVRWAVRFFFASSVGFAVPVSEMGDPTTIGKGLALGAVPCISMKIVSGAFAYVRYASDEARQRSRSASWVTRYLHAQPQQLLVGMAMVARGEFAYMVAETAYVLEVRVTYSHTHTHTYTLRLSTRIFSHTRAHILCHPRAETNTHTHTHFTFHPRGSPPPSLAVRRRRTR